MMELKNIFRSITGVCFKILKNDLTKDGITVFCYHDVSSIPSDFSLKYGLNVPPDIFEFQMDFINQNFNIIGPDDLMNNNIPKNAAVITFDDGFKSYFNTAVPIMRKFSIPSIIFLNMAPIKGEIFWAGLITYLCDNKTDFLEYLKVSGNSNVSEKSHYLFCSKEVVNSYLIAKGKNFKVEVDKFVGNFADLNDLYSVSENDLVFFGNHLYNHYVPLLLSDQEFLDLYQLNRDELDCYPNYRNLFSFPFGQPGTCFSNHQIELLYNIGAERIFSSYPIVNLDIDAQYLHRIPLHSHNTTSGSIWFNIFRKSFYI